MAPKRKRPGSGTTFQVFLNFRGPDTRQGLADVLYHGLLNEGIRVFRDDEEIRKGEDIGKEILGAIEDSMIFVPIFSKNYASSKWCLTELAEMMESMKKSNCSKKILPIFFNVSVDDVKLETGLYSRDLSTHKENFCSDTVQQWEDALKKAGNISGWELKNKGYAEFAKEFVSKISEELKVKHKYVSRSLVERNDQQRDLTMLLDVQSSQDVRMVWIHGMGGVGKTTLAKVVYNQLCHRFDGCSFLLNLRETIERKGIEHLQRQLLHDLGIKSENITDENDGIMLISEKFQTRKVLIVLDDVHDQEQIEKLAGEAGWFGDGSRIIITSRKKNVSTFEGGAIELIEAKPMEFTESMLLFGRHAFGSDITPDDFRDLSEDVVKISGGLPLALEVIGSQFRKSYEHSDRGHWNQMISTLRKIPAKKVQDKLRICYDALDWEAKNIFLDIACFFNGEEKTKACYMWQSCSFEPELRIEELVDASLIKLVNGKKFSMHDQLRDLGRKIVRDEKSKDSGKPCSRIWMHEDTVKVLQLEEGKENVEMLALSCSEHSDPCAFTGHVLQKFNNLRFLRLSGSNISDVDVENALPKLIWLSWHTFPNVYLGNTLCLKNLVVLDLSMSFISETWAGWSHIGMCKELKILDLSICPYLTKLPDVSACTKLQRLILEDCYNLIMIDPSVGMLKQLEYLNLSWSTRMTELPESIGELAKLEFLSLFFCRAIQKLPDSIGDLKSLCELNISMSGITQLPKTITHLQSLKVINSIDTEKFPTYREILGLLNKKLSY